MPSGGDTASGSKVASLIHCKVDESCTRQGQALRFQTKRNQSLPLLILSSSCLIATKQILQQLLRFTNANELPHKCIRTIATRVFS